jgi:glycerol-3-phosphate acyltransferase PlsY
MPTISAVALTLAVAAYLWGALSPADFIARRRGIDLRHYGSGNIGASNLGEQLGPAWKVIAGLADVFKGWAPAALARLWGAEMATVVLVGLATVAGHNWSIWLGLRGGRGIAAALGCCLAWDLRLVVLVLLLFAVAEVTRQGGLISMLALILLAPAAWLWRDPTAVVAGSAALALLIALKRLGANRLPLPRDPRERRAVLWRRLWLDRDVPGDQAWEKRRRFD